MLQKNTGRGIGDGILVFHVLKKIEICGDSMCNNYKREKKRK